MGTSKGGWAIIYPTEVTDKAKPYQLTKSMNFITKSYPALTVEAMYAEDVLPMSKVDNCFSKSKYFSKICLFTTDEDNKVIIPVIGNPPKNSYSNELTVTFASKKPTME